LSKPEESLEYLNKAREIDPNDIRVLEAYDWVQINLPEGPLEKSYGSQTLMDQVFPSSVTETQLEKFREPKRSEKPGLIKRISQNAFYRGSVYLFKKGLLVLFTIFIGVFITISIMNRNVVIGWGTSPAQLDETIENQISRTISLYVHNHPSINNLPEHERDIAIEALYDEFSEEFGLSLPKFQRHLLWAYKAMRMEWGKIWVGEVNLYFLRGARTASFNLNQELLLKYMPNTLLLAGSAYLLVFLLGLPLALHLTRHIGKWYDRLISLIAPLSSIPSWVFGIVLISIFALELNILPAGKMLDKLPPDNQWGYILIVLRHMILPVASIVLSIFFQLVYSWRTYFVTFSSEDYVELGTAMGLPFRRLQRKYILKPSLSYVITSFSLMLVGFWQMTMALEVVFNWPGLGWLYVVEALPNLRGESAYPGDLLTSISLVVIFAYFMGFIVLSLDLVYLLVDPRIRLGKKENKLRVKRLQGHWFKSIKRMLKFKKKTKTKKIRTPVSNNKPSSKKKPIHPKVPSRSFTWKRAKLALQEIIHYPSAIIGTIVILILILGSLYAVIFLPYEKIGDQWRYESFTGEPRVPRLAKPSWMNLFRKNDYLSVMSLNSQAGEATREVIVQKEDLTQINLTFSFNYKYADFPSEVLLYLHGIYDQKRPFTSLVWITPDGRELKLENTSFDETTVYPIDENIRKTSLLAGHPNWENWFDSSKAAIVPTPNFLFANPESDQAKILPGQYQLKLEGFVFEPEGDINAELILLGQVYGAAGTDIYRRDLLVPLLWGMPFALLLGLFGALSTTIISMIFAATGVWFGGWVDNLVQRLIDINLVLPVLAIAIMAYAFLGVEIWVILIVYVFLNAFGSPTKNFRAAFLQIKESPYIEAATVYGASNFRIIFRYMVPHLIPVLLPQLVILIPSFVFLEATLGFFNVNMPYPTWGTVIYQAAMKSGAFYSRFWLLQPIFLLLLTGFGFTMAGFAMERILNPRLRNE
jgi:peptide/nickel transport system permease protein